MVQNFVKLGPKKCQNRAFGQNFRKFKRKYVQLEKQGKHYMIHAYYWRIWNIGQKFREIVATNCQIWETGQKFREIMQIIVKLQKIGQNFREMHTQNCQTLKFGQNVHKIYPKIAKFTWIDFSWVPP